MLSQLDSGTRPDGVDTNTDLSYWHLVAFFLTKMIPAKTQYKTHNSKLLAIVEVFKTWYHNIECCKHEVFVFMNYNNLCQFMNMKSLSSR